MLWGARRGVSPMFVILLVLGVLLIGAGAALIGFGIPIKELSFGPTVILAGAFAFVGGLLLVGLSAIVAELARLRAALKAPMPRPGRCRADAPAARSEVVAPPAEAVAREPVKESVKEAEPVAAPAVLASSAAEEVSAAAIERLRSSIPRSDKVVPEAEETVPLSPTAQQAARASRRRRSSPCRCRDRPARPPSKPASQSSISCSVRARRARQAHRRPRSRKPSIHFGRSVPRASRSPTSVLKSPVRPAQPALRIRLSEAEPAPDAPRERSVAILKSGVVDGMAYTLYADGSIEAQLPQGTVRFGSIAELRAHIESNA